MSLREDFMFAKSMHLLGSAAVAALVASGTADAKVVDFRVVETTSPAFGGAAFGQAGAYERVDAIAEFAIDPKSERGRKIVDLDKAPVDAQGMVRFSTQITLPSRRRKRSVRGRE